MTTQIQRRRGTTAQHSTFTGAVGEVTVDTDKEVLVVHDGAQVGGYPQMRENGSNSALALGSAGTPSLKFAGDTNTGIYSPGADQLALSTSGVGRVFVDASGRVSIGTSNAGGNPFCVQGNTLVRTDGNFISVNDVADTTYWFRFSRNGSNLEIVNRQLGAIAFHTSDVERMRLDSSGRLGVGTSSPADKLHIEGAGQQGLRIRNTTNGSNASPQSSVISFRGFYNSADLARIEVQDRSDSNFGGWINIATQNSSQVLTNAVHIDSSQRVGIGTSSPTSALTVNGSISTVERQNAVIGVNRATSTGNGGDLTVKAGNGSGSGNTSGNLYLASGRGASSATNGFIAFGAAATTDVNGLDAEYVRIDSSGRLGIGTTSAAVRLHVVGSINEQARFETTSGASYINVKGTAGQNILGVEASNAWVGPIESLPLAFKTADTERGRFDTSGRLLIGTSTSTGFDGASAKLQVENPYVAASFVSRTNDIYGSTLYLAKSRGSGATIVQSGDAIGGISFNGADGSDLETSAAYIQAFVDGTPGFNDMPGRLVFSTTADGASSPTERMRITNAGRIFVNTTSPGYDGRLYIMSNQETEAGITTQSSNGAIVTQTVLRVVTGSNTVIGSITHNSLSTSFNTSSDYRLKENVVAVTDGITRLQQLKPSRFNFIADPDKTVDGFIAHEVQDVVPEAITGEKDAVDDNGNPVYQGIDQSKLVPLLTAALQEAIGEIESLKARVAALESA